MQPGLGDAGNARAHIGEPGLRIDAVELGGDDQTVHESGPVAALIRTGEEPRLAAESNTARPAFGGVAREADAAASRKRVKPSQCLSM